MMDNDRLSRRLEVAEACLLSLSVLATAWCAYESTLWSGIQTFRIAQSNTKGRHADQEQIKVDQHRLMDGNVILHFADAVVEKKDKVVEFYLQRARPDLRAALQAWLDADPLNNPAAPVHPGATALYQAMHAKALEPVNTARREAEAKMDEANEANQISDKYVMLTVLFASVLCLLGIATKFEVPKVRLALLCFASVIFLITAVVLWEMPLARE